MSLCAVFALAKAALWLGCIADGSASGLRTPWAVPALLLEDLAVACGLWLLSLALERLRLPLRGARWLGYALACVYTAANVPVARVCSTPLTYPMLPAAGGALSDSLRLYVTAGNVLSVLFVLAAAAALPALLLRRRPGVALLGAALLLGVLGPAARARVDSRGLHRNALWTLARTAAYGPLNILGAPPVVTAAPPPLPSLPPPRSPAAGDADPDLSRLRGAASRRNVLWIVLESTAAQYLRAYGAAPNPMADPAPDPTPRLTDLGRRGVRFDRAYAVYPESIKGLFAALCSTTPAAHTPAARYTEAQLPCASVAAQLAGAGYVTGMFHSGWFLYLGMAGIVQGRGFAELWDAGRVGGAYATSFGVDERATVRRVLEFIDRRPAGRPFFAMYLPIAGHHPYFSPGPPEGARPRPFAGATELDRYRNDLALGDAALGELMDGLSGRGLLDDTLIVVNGDHGEAFGQHEGNRAHSLFLYEENVRVPLWLVPPGGAGRLAGAATGQVASLLDLAPTILDLCGVAIPARYQGRSLLVPRPDAAARFLTDHAVWLLGLRQGRYKFLYEVERDRGRLYDLATDPGEQQDLSARLPELYQRYRADVLGVSARQGAWLAGAY